MPSLIGIIAGYYAFTNGSRVCSKHNFFIKLDPPVWIRRLLFLPKYGKISLVGLIMQVIVSFLTCACLLNWIGINIFAPFGDFTRVFKTIGRWAFWLYLMPVIVYTTIVIYLIFKRN